MLFTAEITVRFGQVDAAGIVYYPRYLEMVNDTVERWFEEALGIGFNQLHLERHRGTPTRRIAVEFLRPSRLGDKLTFALKVKKIGRSSFDVDIVCSCNGETRLTAAVTLVYASFAPFAASPIPDDLRALMMTYADADA